MDRRKGVRDTGASGLGVQGQESGTLLSKWRASRVEPPGTPQVPRFATLLRRLNLVGAPAARG